MDTITPIVEATLARRAAHPPALALLVGLSGIDGCGKGYVAGQLLQALTARGQKAAVINVDGWLNLPPIRFEAERSAQNFYENALRLDELFTRLLLPLRQNRRVHVTMDWVDETATASRPYTYDFDSLDVVVLEGAYIFKRAYRSQFDLAVWVDCSWETALERSIARSQEGLSPEETVRAYQTTFFPAEEIHFVRDDPRGRADLIVSNDARLNSTVMAGVNDGEARPL
jgi:uridine kinase